MSSENARLPARCPLCQAEMPPSEAAWAACPNCEMLFQPYTPSPEERAESRALLQRWRQLLLVVAELHNLGYERARVVPWIEDTPGGGDWQCIVAPAALTSPSHGARIDEHIAWWGGTDPPGRHFPYVIGRGFRGLPGLPPELATARNLLLAYPRLAKQSLGRDRGYVQWYRDMLRATEPDRVIYAHAYWDYHNPRPISHVHALGPAGERDVLVPLPPAKR